MNRSFFLLLFLFGGISCDRPLSGPENQRWKDYCGTMPSHQSQFIDEKRQLYGGELISGDKAPWVVQVGRAETFCSGTLISQRHVLLASHCIMYSTKTAPPKVKQSSRSCDGDDMILKQDNDYYYVNDSSGQLLSNRVSKMIFLNYCSHQVVDHDDFMIMELKEDIQPSTFVFPACISDDPSFQQTGLTIRIVGLWRGGLGFLIYNEESKTATRPGDSGGCVIHYANGRYYVIGVVNGAMPNQFVSGITSVAAHYNRICYHTGRCN